MVIMVFLLVFNRCNHYSKDAKTEQGSNAKPVMIAQEQNGDKGVTDHESAGSAHSRFECGDIETKFHGNLREVKRQGVIACFTWSGSRAALKGNVE